MQNAKLKIFFDTNPLTTGHAVRGIGVYTKNLVEALKELRDIQLVDKASEADIAHYPYFDLYFNTLKPLDKPTVVTIFDVIPLIYPKHYPIGVRGRWNFIKQKKALKAVRAVITISETSKKDIVRFLDVPAEKIHVTYLAARPSFKKLETGNWKLEITKRYGLPERFVLYVGDVNYNKNINVLAAACKLIKMPLVIVGKQAAQTNFDRRHPENQSFVKFLEEFGQDRTILRIGYVPDEDLVKIYNLASVYCQASLYEGFGLPVLEAMQCGVPVVITKTQALVEVAGEVACICESTEPRDIALGLKGVIGDEVLRNKYILDGFQRVRNFNWKRVSSQTVIVYEKIAK